MRPRASKEQWEEMMGEVSTAHDQELKNAAYAYCLGCLETKLANGVPVGQAMAQFRAEIRANTPMAMVSTAREFDPFRADEQASQAFIDSCDPGYQFRLATGQQEVQPLLKLLLAVAASLRKRGLKTSELCQELIKADVEEGLK